MGRGLVIHQLKAQRMQKDCLKQCLIGLILKKAWILIEWEFGVSVLVVIGLLKLAHLYKERIVCSVSQGGPVHYAFELDWIMKQERGEYPFEFFETVTYAFDLSGYEEWVEYAPKLSLLRQGILDKLSAPLLLVNGLYDSVIPI